MSGCCYTSFDRIVQSDGENNSRRW